MIHYLRVSLFAALLFLGACNNSENNNTGKKQADSTRVAKAPIVIQQPAAAIKINDDMLNAVYQQYLKLTKALREGDLADAKLAGNGLEAGAEQVPGGATIANTAEKITTASSVGMQRNYLSALSNEMANLIKRSGMKSGEIYLNYCPMALNDKGAYWLSSEKNIRNPYFGAAMLTCGEIKETIK